MSWTSISWARYTARGRPHLRQSKGALICVGSIESDRGVPFQSAYAASKHAIKGWLDALRVELRKEHTGVRVTLIKPTSIDTPLFEHAKTQIGVKPRGVPPVYAPELVADAIMYAAEHDDRELYVGAAARVMSLTERIQPLLNDLQLRLIGFRGQRTEEPRSPDAPHNLYAPVASDGWERGSTSGRTKERSLYPWVSRHRFAGVAAAAALGVGALVFARGRPLRAFRG